MSTPREPAGEVDPAARVVIADVLVQSPRYNWWTCCARDRQRLSDGATLDALDLLAALADAGYSVVRLERPTHLSWGDSAYWCGPNELVWLDDEDAHGTGAEPLYRVVKGDGE